MFSPFGRNTLTNLLRRAEQFAEIPVVEDQRVNPTSALDLAGVILTIADNLVCKPGDRALYGMFHLAGSGVASPAEFIEALLPTRPDMAAFVPGLIASTDLGCVQRPLASARLDCARDRGSSTASSCSFLGRRRRLRLCAERNTLAAAALTPSRGISALPAKPSCTR